MERPDLTSPRAVVGLIALIAAAVLGNVLKLTLSFQVDILFGSIAVLTALRLYGTTWGAIAALVAGSYTFVLWNHPYAMLIFTAEAIFVGLVLRRTPRAGLLLVDGAYWLLVGAPLVYLLYGGVMDMSGMSTTVVALKQSVNGILNALIASLLLNHFPVQRWVLGSSRRIAVSLHEVLYNLVAALVLVPALSLMLIDGRVQLRAGEERLRQDLSWAAEDIGSHVRSWVRQHMHAVRTLAGVARQLGTAPSAELQEETATITSAFPDFHNMYVANADGTTVAFHPPVNARGESTIGLNFADRDYFRRLRATRREVISDVFPGRGGIFAPIVTFSAPVMRDGEFEGFALGALDLGHLGSLLGTYERETSLRISLIDRRDLVIASTAPELEPHQGFHHAAPGRKLEVRGDSYRWMPTARGLPAMTRWQGSYYVTESSVAPDLPWTLVVEASLAPLQTVMYTAYSRNLLVMLVLAVFALAVAFLISRWMARPVARLARITGLLPDRLLRDTPEEWPSSSVNEIQTLIHNTRSMRGELRESFRQLHNHGADLERVNLALRQEIAERQRLEEQVRQKQKMEAIGTLAGGIAHDFNNILTAILGYAELAKHDAADRPQAQKSIDQVIVSASRAKRLVQQILTFSRRRAEARVPVLLQPILREALTLLRATLPSTIAIEEHCDQAAGAVIANPTQIHQIVMNLSSNAEAAMRDHGGVLEVRLDDLQLDRDLPVTHPPLAPGRYLRLRVRDTGRGIDPKRIDRIFEPFYTTKQVGEGTGMGLAVVHGIVAGHGGSIAVNSELGRGTTVEIYLPRVHERPVDQPVEHPRHPQGQGRILVVDDEQAIVELEQEVLEQHGYDVTAAHSGSEALEELRRDPERYDLIITDQTMPGMTGDELAREARVIRPDLPIILCTGYSHRIDDERARALGIDAFLMKPFAARDLAGHVSRLLGARSSRSAS